MAKTVTLVVKDEVNCQLVGLELAERKVLSNKFKYEIPGARYQPAVRLGRWDGKAAFFQMGGSTYVNLLDEIVPYITSQGYDIDLDDRRNYQTVFSFTEVDEKTFAHKVWPKNHQMAGQPVVLRDYQIAIINDFLRNPQCIQEIATGAGKTLITAALSWSCEPHGRTIVIVPNKSLVTQTEDDYINLGLDVGVYFGDRKELGRTHTICTWQSLNILLKNTMAASAEFTVQDFLQDVCCFMVDETHMAKAEALKTLLTGVMSHIPIRWGLTGTVPKEDYEFVSIKCSIGNVIGRLSASTLQEQGVLANCHVNIVQMMDSVEYKDYQSELKYLTTNTERLAYLAQIIEKIKDGGNTLILVDRIETGKILQAELSTLFSLLSDKPDVSFVSGITKVRDRKEQYDSVATSNNQIIIATYGVAAVGINIPRIFNLILVEPGKSFVRVIQSIGRGIRKAEDKDWVQIWDITSTCKFAKRHLTVRKKYYTEAKYPFTIEKIDWQTK